jgi:hypothetical protein
MDRAVRSLVPRIRLALRWRLACSPLEHERLSRRIPGQNEKEERFERTTTSRKRRLGAAHHAL